MESPAARRDFLRGIRHSGMVRKHQTRNLEIPGSMLRIAPE
jgi:D-alanyl-D-alanine dipeptidase